MPVVGPPVYYGDTEERYGDAFVYYGANSHTINSSWLTAMQSNAAYTRMRSRRQSSSTMDASPTYGRLAGRQVVASTMDANPAATRVD